MEWEGEREGCVVERRVRFPAASVRLAGFSHGPLNRSMLKRISNRKVFVRSCNTAAGCHLAVRI